MALKVKWKDRWTLTPKNWNQFEFFHLLGQSNHLGQFTNFSTPTSLIVKHSSCLNGWFSRCGIQTRSIILTWELVSNANSQASPQMLGMRNFEHSSAFWQTLKGILKFENSWLKWSPSCFLIPTCHNSIYKHLVWGRWISNWGDCTRFEFFFPDSADTLASVARGQGTNAGSEHDYFLTHHRVIMELEGRKELGI